MINPRVSDQFAHEAEGSILNAQKTKQLKRFTLCSPILSCQVLPPGSCGMMTETTLTLTADESGGPK
jgi:hypothetical protein